MRSRSSLRGHTRPTLLHVAVLVALTATVLPTPAVAQGLLEALFGPSKPSHPYPQAQPYRAPMPVPHAVQRPAAGSGQASYSPALRDHDDGAGSGSYRTVCVRMCDGYYWPISHNVSRGRMSRDANICRSSCGEEARLFYMPARTSDIDDAVDLQGKPYAKLTNAFLYRKRLVDGCACRPAPWTDIEAARHSQYLMAELASRPRREGSDEPPLGPRLTARSAQEIGADSTVLATAEPAAPLASTVVAEAPAARVVTPPLVERPAAITVADAAEPAPRQQPQQPARRPRASRPDATAVQPQYINRRTAAAPLSPMLSVQAKPPMAPGMFSGLGGPPKYAWPGDPVRR